MRPRRRIGRPQARGGKPLGEIFQDRQRLPDVDAVVVQRRHLAGAGNLRHARLEVRSIERDHNLVEGDAGDLHGDPGTERPRRIILVTDDERKRQDRPPLPTRRFHTSRDHLDPAARRAAERAVLGRIDDRRWPAAIGVEQNRRRRIRRCNCPSAFPANHMDSGFAGRTARPGPPVRAHPQGRSGAGSRRRSMSVAPMHLAPALQSARRSQ